jgi:cysteinyl-tRNA synthetase
MLPRPEGLAMVEPLRLFNTRTREIETFQPLVPGRASLYSCGPTVYNFAHIGNLRAYVFVDTLKRALQWRGYQVMHVMNLTDVGHLTDDADAGEDKMELAARRAGRDIWDLSRAYTAAFFEHTGDLGILPPDVVCRATDHLPEQIDLVRRIEATGAAYRIDDGIYLDTAKVPGYADFARLSVAGQEAGARVDMVQGKRNPTDFALWKFARGEKRQMEWESPWGRGFPGWHLECSAMATHYLGDRFDLHTGGIDHIPVHHTNEIAQMRAATGRSEWVNTWLHNNFLVIDRGEETSGEKMAKSGENFLTLSVLRRWGIQPLAYRYFLLGAHYRKELKFSRANVEQAASGLTRLWREVAALRAPAAAAPASGTVGGATESAGYRQRFAEAIADDLNTPRALAEVWGAVRDEAIAPADRFAFACDADRVLGLRLGDGPIGGAGVDPARVEAVIARRKAARAAKDFAAADQIRDLCAALGIRLKDGPQGTTWEMEG